MAKLSDSEKRKISRRYSSVLFNLYLEEKITNDEMETILDDIFVIKDLVLSPAWQDLLFNSTRFGFNNEEIEELFDKLIIHELKSPLSVKWIRLHIQQGHYSILQTSIRYIEENIISIFLESPDYIEYTISRKKEFSDMFRIYYQRKVLSNPRSKFIKIYFLNKKSDYSWLINDRYRKLANDLFDFQIDILKKNLLKN